MPTENCVIHNCLKGATTVARIQNVFNADDVCMKCPNIIYINGMITCKYGESKNKGE